jgi:hypothetical protein
VVVLIVAAAALSPGIGAEWQSLLWHLLHQRLTAGHRLVSHLRGEAIEIDDGAQVKSDSL